MSLADLIPAPLRAYAALGLAICVVASLSAAYFTGRSHGWDAHVVVSDREKAAQDAANREAARLAGEQYLRNVDRLILEKEILDAALATQAEQADADPDADTCGVGLGSVQRLNRIQ